MAKVSLRAYNQEIETMIDRGHLDEAIAHAKHILKTFPKHLDTYRLLGKAYLEYKKFPEAADIFSRVLVSVPSDFVANVGMSIVRDEENKLDDAIWHMERAFETQPSNAAIQSELQRLYGRREGTSPPRIRMTRGALAYMYVQGELYPQAISEIKSVLKDDPGRNDMQALLARAYYRSGLKNDAAEIASGVLRTNPYNLDANRILVEILGPDHPESVQAYRQRVVELDPYAAQVTGSIFMSNEVPAAAVSLEHLDWNGQPVGMRPDWEATQAISLESGTRPDEQPQWLKNTFSESPPSQPTPVSVFDEAPPPDKPAEPADNIPDFLREAGWGQSTGAFDESKSVFSENVSTSGEAPIEQGDLPDWVKALAPEQPAEKPAQEEEMPDWINKIGTSGLPVAAAAASSDQADWINQFDQSPPAQPAEEQPDWLKGFGEAEQPAAAAAEEPDWLKGLTSEVQDTPSAEAGGELDWLSQLSTSPESKEAEIPSNDFDFLNPLGQLNTASSTPSDEDFLKGLSSQPEATSATSSTDEFDFLNEFAEEGEQLAPSSRPEVSTPEPALSGIPGMSEEEQEDSFAWLENLAAKQGATEGLLTKPEDRLEQEPDWLKQAKEMDSSTPVLGQPAAHLEELGKSEQDRDDSFAWLETLAAKQGANEGLLTKPEDRLEEEPEWIRQAKSLSSQPQEAPSAPAPQQEQPPIPEPTASVADLGKSEQERDDAFAWLESLAAKQGATEGLLTKPEDRLEEEPDWIKHAKDVSAEQSAPVEPVSEQPAASEQAEWRAPLEEAGIAAPEPQEEPDWLQQSREVRAEESASADETRVWLRSLEKEEAAPIPEPQEHLEEQPEWMKPGEEIRAEEPPAMTPVVEQPALADDTASWLQSLDDEVAHPETEISSADDTAMWFKSLDEEELKKVTAPPAQPEPKEELPAWMQDVEEAKAVEEGAPTLPEVSQEAAEGTDWMGAIEKEPEPVAEATPKLDTGSLPSWLREFEKEEAEASTFAAQEDLPAWLRDETGDVLAEPTKIEPTRATDWQPVEMKQPEPELPTPELVSPPPQPEPVDVVAILEEKIATVPTQEPEKPAPPAKPPKEPVMHKGTDALTDPVLGTARGELSRSNLPTALDNYDRLIRKGRFLEDVIYDLREASYRYPVDVSIWQSLGDAYMRSNRLQDALDAYTKAEELLR